MPTQATIAITPGAGQFLDAVSLTVGSNLVVRETMVIADPSNATNLATVNSDGTLNVALPTATITALTPPTAAAIASAIVANPPTVGISGTVPISGTVAATQSGTWTVGISAAQTIAVTNSGTFAVQASITTLGQQLAAASVPVVLTAAQITTLTPPSTVAVTQSTSPWIVASNLTHNNAAPSTANLGVLSAVANASAPTFTEGKQVLLSTDLSGNLRTSGTFTGTVTGAVTGTLTNNNAAPSTNNIGALTVLANAADPTWTEGDLVTASANLAGYQRVLLQAETTKVIGTINISASQKIEVYDGTNTATVKAASTAALAADTAIVVTEPGSTTAGACANTAVTSTSSAVLAANTARREVIIVNTDVVAVYIGLGQTPTATAYHVVLKPCTTAHDGTGGSFVSDIFKGAVNAIVASTSGHVAVTELT